MAGKEGERTKKCEETPPRAFTEGDFVVYPNHGGGSISGIERRPSSARTAATTSSTGRWSYGEHPRRRRHGPEGLRGRRGGRRGAHEIQADATHALQLEPPSQAQPGEDKERRDLAGRRGGAQPERPRCEHGLSTGERNMLTKARQILTSEIALARTSRPPRPSDSWTTP